MEERRKRRQKDRIKKKNIWRNGLGDEEKENE